MMNLLKTEMMNLMNRVDVGTIKTSAQFNNAIAEMCIEHDADTVGQVYCEMFKCCSPTAQAKIDLLARGM